MNTDCELDRVEYRQRIGVYREDRVCLLIAVYRVCLDDACILTAVLLGTVAEDRGATPRITGSSPEYRVSLYSKYTQYTLYSPVCTQSTAG